MPNLHPDVEDLVVDRLGELVDKLHEEARILKRHDHMAHHQAALRGAADYLSEVRKEVQRS